MQKNIPFETIAEFIEQILEANREAQLPFGKGVELSVLHAELNKLADGKFNYKDYGYSKFIKLLDSVPRVHLQTNDGKLFKCFLASNLPPSNEKRQFSDIADTDISVHKKIKVEEPSSIKKDPTITNSSVKKHVGSFYISAGTTEFNLAVTEDTTEIIFLDLDNATSWISQFLHYISTKNGGRVNKSNVLCIGFCGISYDTTKLQASEHFYIIQMDIAAKESADHSITYFAGRVWLEHKLNQELGRLPKRRLLFTIVSKDLALANVVHFLKHDGADALFLANSASVQNHCK